MSRHDTSPRSQYEASAQNLQFYSSSYSLGGSSRVVSSQASYGYSAPAGSLNYPSFDTSGTPEVTGRLGEYGGLRTGLLAAFSTEGYEHEPSLMEELDVNIGHIKAKVSMQLSCDHQNCGSPRD